MQFPQPPKPQFGFTYSEKLKPGKNPVWFISEGFKLAGNVFTPADFEEGKKYPTIITVTPAGAIKEQAAGMYAMQLSEAGYVTLAFDHRTFGESEGWPRYREDPFMKVYDIKNAITFMTCLDVVDPGGNIGSDINYVGYAVGVL